MGVHVVLTQEAIGLIYRCGQWFLSGMQSIRSRSICAAQVGTTYLELCQLVVRFAICSQGWVVVDLSITFRVWYLYFCMNFVKYYVGLLRLVVDLFLTFRYFVRCQQLRFFECFELYRLEVQLMLKPFVKFYMVYILVSRYVYPHFLVVITDSSLANVLAYWKFGYRVTQFSFAGMILDLRRV